MIATAWEVTTGLVDGTTVPMLLQLVRSGRSLPTSSARMTSRCTT